jgi:ATP-dependent exoDNAse (exonuclease V) beta subunit
VTRPFADQEARDIIRADIDATLVVEAAAGTGKTTALVGRVVEVVRRGAARLDQIAAVTFTEKAAGEMKLRLRDELDRARTAPGTPEAERAHLSLALSQLEVARIGTIHGFCADLLKEHPVEAGVDPLFEVSAEDEAQRLFDGAFDIWFQRALGAPPEGVRRLVRRRPARRDAAGPRLLLRDAAWSLAGHRDFPAEWRRDPWDRTSALDAAVAALAELGLRYGGRASRTDDYLAQNVEQVARWAKDLERLERVRGRDHDGLEAELAQVLRWRSWRWTGGRRSSYGPGIDRPEVLAARDAAKAVVERTVSDAEADLAACLQGELRAVVAAYEDAKKRAGRLDFLDLLVFARDLVKASRPVRERLQGALRRFFVDEVQDIDPLQAEILLLLSADDPVEEDWTRVSPVPGKLFLVGDPKQSIYRFRRADVTLYEKIKRSLVEEAGARLVHLTASFRSTPSIQQAVNAAFARGMAPAAGSEQAPYVPLTPVRDDVPSQPAIVALPVPRPYSDYGKLASWVIEESYPDAVGAFVAWLVRESGWTVEAGGQRVPIAPRHVCILLKRFKSWEGDATREYVRALEGQRVPHVLLGGRSFHDREEVIAVSSALAAIEWPDDELSVYATLRGPFFALGDDELLAWRGAFGGLHPLRRVPEGASPIPTGHPTGCEALGPETRGVAEALGILARLHFGRNRRPVADTLARLLEATRAHAGVAVWPRGEQALANVLRVLDLARSFESRGTTSFRAFVEHLAASAGRADAAEAPVVEEGTEGVRLMTVHRAKGLEFPVVILADPTAPEVHDKPSRFFDPARGLWLETLAFCAPAELREHHDEAIARDREEAVRLAYVAATRAKDLLVVPVVGDASEIDGWLRVLSPAVFPLAADRRAAQPRTGCPAFGRDTVLERPAQAQGSPLGAMAPGEHSPEVGEHRVVFWDPALLHLGESVDVGLRQQQILKADETGSPTSEARRGGETTGASDASVRAHASWREERGARIEKAARPTVAVTVVTEALREGADLALAAAVGEPVEHLSTETPRTGRPHGRRFGTLVHAVLAAVELGADGAEVADVALAQGRLVGASPEEIAAAADAVRGALAHPVLQRAAKAQARGGCRREVPVLVRRADGSLLEGVVDLAFRETEGKGKARTDRWTVVDFKTDVEIGRGEAYERQVRAYAEAIAAVTGEQARAVLLSV